MSSSFESLLGEMWAGWRFGRQVGPYLNDSLCLRAPALEPLRDDIPVCGNDPFLMLPSRVVKVHGRNVDKGAAIDGVGENCPAYFVTW